MNQYPMGMPTTAEHQLHHPNCTSSGGTLMRSPSPLMGMRSPGTLNRNPHSHGYSTSAAVCGSGGGTLKRGQNQLPMSIPDCVQPVPNAVYNPDFNNGSNQFDMGGGGCVSSSSANACGSGGGPIRLYMNQVSGIVKMF